MGYNILHVAGDCLRPNPSFESQVLKIQGTVMAFWRKDLFRNLTGIEEPESVDQINECLVNDENDILSCAKEPPSVQETRS